MPNIEIPNMENAELYAGMLDPGPHYLVNVQELPQIKEAKTGTKQIQLTMTVLSGPDQKSPDPQTGSLSPAGRKVTDFIALSAAFRVKQLLIAAGLLARDDKTSALAKGNFNTDLLMGTKFSITIEPDMYDGKEKRRVKYEI
jgi:hypothetical protein